jgi:hypothetical protein
MTSTTDATAAQPLTPYQKPCSICNLAYDDNEWGILGYIGILPVSFCPTCMNGIFDMVEQIKEDLD